MPEYSIKYGASALNLRLPSGLDLACAKTANIPRLADPITELREGLLNPTGRPPLKLVAKGQESCVILVTHCSLPAAYDVWLAELLNQINAAGIPDNKITLYIANGLHAPMTDKQRQDHFGPQVCKRVKFVDHDPDSPKLGKVGRTDWGTTLTVDETVFRCDMLLLTGAIQYHPIAGFTGGRYGILPGVCGRESIRTNAKRGFKGSHLAGGVGPGIMVNSPVSEDMHEACTLVKPNLAIDVVLNEDGDLAWIGVGDYGYIHKIGAKLLSDAAHTQLPLRGSVAVIGCGAPASNTLESACHSLLFASAGINDGAMVIWAAECASGEGSQELGEWRNMSAEDAALKLPTSSFTDAAISGFFLKQFASRFKVQMLTNLDAETVQGWGFSKAESMDQALASAAAIGRPDQLIWLVVPDSSNALVDIKPASRENVGE